MKEKIHFKTIVKKFLWTIGAILSSFIIAGLISGLIYEFFGLRKFSWTGFVQGSLFIMGGLVIIFLIYKKFIIKKVGEKIGKVFLIVCLMLLFLGFLRMFFFDYLIMTNDGLKPYINKWDYIIFQKINSSLKKGDIVITRNKDNFITSLVIGLPGDKIELKDGIFFINGEPLKNVSYNFYHVYGIDSNTGNYFIIVPPDSFFGIPTLLDKKFADNEQTMQKQLTASNNICPNNSYLNPKDNLCYCNEGFIWNKKEGKDAKCVKGIDLSIDLYKQSDILGKVIHCFHIGK